MKTFFITLKFICMSSFLFAQVLTPVKWSYAAKRTSKTEAVILLKATIENGWHIYSQHLAEGGPVKTVFTFSAGNNYELSGKTTEPTPVTKYEKAFGMEVSYFENSVIFKQRIRLKRTGPLKISGGISYMTCNAEKCLPPDDLSFSVLIK
ncbi:protein-disulfide reductase DsbD domain-containing protein [Mucilaginibacter psychrotolerans]|uniref:Sugar transporter n=1 Tax=Mucilaginibacter psychrotolerans TaxID=1524096 RepID=A0A4Y8SFT3_9SPHI|nr:protein-disulfide reductase DsbD domain-containing protein [Mucilaginibacter psychrotolerans]TFF37768.1 sugar transporter [Mucilaginibacter psychrotolerans]